MAHYLDRYSRLELLIYLVSWIFILTIPVAVQIYEMTGGESHVMEWRPMAKAYEVMIPIFLLFLVNNFLLLPQLFFKHRKIIYCVCVAALFALLWVLQTPPPPRRVIPDGAEQFHPRRFIDMFHLTNLIIELCVILGNFAIKVYIQSLRREMMMLNIKAEKMRGELESLKYQISPHFLMNTLNNIQSLIEISPRRAYDTIQRLSRMMRYFLYDNSSESVALSKEIGLMRDFIALMKIRYPETVKVTAEFPDNTNGINIPPLLFISFLENAFKYGVTYDGESFVNARLQIDGSRLMFSCVNSINPVAVKTKAGKGIGIENVRRRLELLYSKDHELNITQREGMFMVELQIPITDNKQKES